MQRKRRGRGWVLLLLLCLAFLVFLCPALGRRPAAVDCEVTKAELVVVRRETVLVSPAVGRLELLVREGERAAAGQIVARIWPFLTETGTPKALSAPSPGVVWLTVDGLEAVLTPEAWTTLRPEGILHLAAVETRSAEEGKRVEQGEPILKLVDDLAPVLLVGQWPPSSHWRPETGQEVEVRVFSSQKGWAAARTVASERGYFLLEIRQGTSDWLSVRRVTAEVRAKR